MSKNYAVCCREVLSNIFNSIDTMSSNYVRQRNGNYNWFLRVQKCSVAFKIYVFVYNSSGTSVNIANESRWQLAATLKETIKTWLITIIDAHFYILNSESEFDCIVSLRNLIFFKYKKKVMISDLYFLANFLQRHKTVPFLNLVPLRMIVCLEYVTILSYASIMNIVASSQQERELVQI